MEFRVRYLTLFRLFPIMKGLEWFWMGSLHKDIKFMLEFFKAVLFLLYINDLPDVISNTAIYIGDSTLYSKCDPASDQWQQLELASELKADL